MITFGTDGWRAVVADQFTFENVRLVTQAIANYVLCEHPTSDIRHPTLVVGYDNRFMAEEFAKAVCGVLAANEVEVLLAKRPVPTPTVAFAVKSRGADGAIMLTASHNSFYYNGLKFIPHYAGPATKGITQRIEAEIGKAATAGVKRLSDNELDKSPYFETTDIEEEYLLGLEKLLDMSALKKASLRVVIDPLYGAGNNLLPRICQMGGLKTTTIHANRDVLFGGELPDPSERNLGELRDQVLANKADLGLSTDGDADRFGVIADDGTFISANTALALLLIHLHEDRRFKGAVVRTVATTHLIDAIAKNYGIEVIETPVGFKYIGQLMLDREIIIGGEESGGLSIGGHIPEKDGLLANLLMCEMVATRKKRLSEILKDIVAQYGEYENVRLDIPLASEVKDKLLYQLNEEEISQVGVWKVVGKDLKDGIRLLLEGERWMLFRPSGTEPLVRVYIEARSKQDIEQLKQSANKLIGRNK